MKEKEDLIIYKESESAKIFGEKEKQISSVTKELGQLKGIMMELEQKLKEKEDLINTKGTGNNKLLNENEKQIAEITKELGQKKS